MKRCRPPAWLRPGCELMLTVALFSLVIVSVFALAWTARAAAPEISFIERYINQQVLIHFDTEPNRTYRLQWASSLTLTSKWTTITTVPPSPDPDHFIIVDSATAPKRFYRLSVTP